MSTEFRLSYIGDIIKVSSPVLSKILKFFGEIRSICKQILIYKINQCMTKDPKMADIIRDIVHQEQTNSNIKQVSPKHSRKVSQRI